MAKHLTVDDVNTIVNLIRGWEDAKFGWDLICDAAAPLVGKRPTRQSLPTHEPIMDAYKAKKKQRKTGVGNTKSRPASLAIAGQRIDNLTAKNAELEEKLRRYKQQFTIWQYNAYKHGMTEWDLNEPLPEADRERSDGEKR